MKKYVVACLWIIVILTISEIINYFIPVKYDWFVGYFTGGTVVTTWEIVIEIYKKKDNENN